MTSPALPPGLLQELYADLAAEIAQLAPVCEVSGRCCRFQEYGHRLYLTQPEADLLLENGLPPGSVVDEAGCPFQINGLCTARERRPLGCRVYFCDPNYAGRAEELTERYLQRLKQMHITYGIAWDYGSLHAFLDEYVANSDNE